MCSLFEWASQAASTEEIAQYYHGIGMHSPRPDPECPMCREPSTKQVGVRDE